MFVAEKIIEKIVGRLTFWGTRTALILETQIPNILPTYCRKPCALIAITSAQSRPAVGAGGVPAGIRNIATPTPNSKEPLTTSTTT